MDIQQFEGRKREHIVHALNPAHQASGLNGLDQIHLIHEALPELDFQDIHLRSECLGKPCPTPFYVAGMTAGHARAREINEAIARACEARDWAMGVGSQRRELEGGSESDGWAGLRKLAPKLTLFANLGIAQLVRARTEQVRKLVDSLEAQALVIHANALQEAIQPEGTPNFKGAHEALKRVCRELSVPVVLKETGCGFSAATLARLRETGLAAIDVSGLGGTHWGRIEGARAPEGSAPALAAETFREWGIPTVQCVRNARSVFSDVQVEVWASGGVRSGLDAAKLIALGAHRIGYAQPALEAALAGNLNAWMQRQEFELKVALFCTGSESPAALRGRHAEGSS